MINYFIAPIAGVLLALSFAPFYYWPLAILSLILLNACWYQTTAIQAMRLGWCFGLGFFGTGVSWVYVSIHEFGYTPPWLAAIFTFLFIAFLSLFPALQGYYLKKRYHHAIVLELIIGFPVSWLLLEMLRGWLLTGFPWLNLGTSQTTFILSAYAPIAGVYVISFILALTASTLYYLIDFRLQKSKSAVISCSLGLCGIWGASLWLKTIEWTQAEDTHAVHLIQGNIKPNDKFLLDNPIQTTWQVYGKPTFEDPSPSLIIWPENSLPLPLSHAKSFIDKLQGMAQYHGLTLILGLPIESTSKANHYYNALIVLGDGHGTYRKTHLVPFGEYLPLERWLRGLIDFFNIPMSSFIAAPFEQIPLQIPNMRLLPLICYEIAYPNYVRQQLKLQNAGAIMTISEDGWFGNSFGPHQHLQITQMRALETGRYILRSTTSGISAIINHHGHIVQQSPQFQSYVLKGSFQERTGLTPWVKWGPMPLVLLCVTLLFLPIRKKSYLFK